MRYRGHVWGGGWDLVLINGFDHSRGLRAEVFWHGYEMKKIVMLINLFRDTGRL